MAYSTSKITLTQEQQRAVDAIVVWHRKALARKAPLVFRLTGPAGTGKTTIAAVATRKIGVHTAYAAVTGKAAAVMREKGMPAQTLHSLIYQPPVHNADQLSFVQNGTGLQGFDLLHLDEASMVDNEVGEDLLSFGVPILAIGDQHQLPPINSNGFLLRRSQKWPEANLRKIHRQAAQSPIIQIATRIREGKPLKPRRWSRHVKVTTRTPTLRELSEADQIVCGRNNTRRQLNSVIKRYRGFGTQPLPRGGEKFICVQNDHRRGLINGTPLKLLNVGPTDSTRTFFIADVVRDDGAMLPRVRIATAPFLSPNRKLDFSDGLVKVDYAYAITCHKAQGSEWDSVIVFDESDIFGADKRRWLYTAVTRARNELLLVQDWRDE